MCLNVCIDVYNKDLFIIIGVVPQGDSGGPLVCEHSINDDTGSLYEGLYFVTGVTSWGSQSCSEDPSVFASVANVAQWISDTSQG